MIDGRGLGQRWARRVLGDEASGEMDERVWRAYPDGGWEAYRAEIMRCGNPADQIARFERAGIILQPKQLLFSAWARRLDTADHLPDERGSPELGFGGAKGPGKSFGSFTQMAVDDCQRFAGVKWLYLRKTGKKALEQIQDLVGSVLAKVDHTYTIGLIRFPNGSQILIGHFNHEKEALNYAGIEYDGILVEEGTHLSARAHRALNQSLRTSKIGWRPRKYNTFNPLGIGHQYHKKRYIDHERTHAKVENRTRKFIFANVDDNKFVSADYRGNLESLPTLEKKAYLEGDWDVSAGAYFDEWRYERHVVATVSPDRHHKVWASMDYGFNHWNMIYLHMEHDGVITTFEEIGHRKHYPSEIVPDVVAVLGKHGLTLDKLDTFLVGADVFSKTGAAKQSVAEQYRELGVTLAMAEMGPGSRVAGAIHMSKLLGNEARGMPSTWFVTANCKRLWDTMPYLERNPNKPEDVIKVDADDNGDGGDDAYDAVRYGLYRGRIKRLKATGTSYVD